MECHKGFDYCSVLLPKFCWFWMMTWNLPDFLPFFASKNNPPGFVFASGHLQKSPWFQRNDFPCRWALYKKKHAKATHQSCQCDLKLSGKLQGSLNGTYFGGIKLDANVWQVLRHLPVKHVLFGLVSYTDPGWVDQLLLEDELIPPSMIGILVK